MTHQWDWQKLAGQLASSVWTSIRDWDYFTKDSVGQQVAQAADNLWGQTEDPKRSQSIPIEDEEDTSPSSPDSQSIPIEDETHSHSTHSHSASIPIEDEGEDKGNSSPQSIPIEDETHSHSTHSHSASIPMEENNGTSPTDNPPLSPVSERNEDWKTEDWKTEDWKTEDWKTEDIETNASPPLITPPPRNVTPSTPMNSPAEPDEELEASVNSTSNPTPNPSPQRPPRRNPEGYEYFIAEAQDLLTTIETELFALTPEAETAEIYSLMRATHTLKGAAANVGQDTIKTISHNLEDIFRALLSPDATIDQELLSMLFEGYDCLRLAMSAELAGEYDQDDDLLNRAADIFIRFQRKLGDCFDHQPPLPTSTEMGFDLTKSIFEMGVTQRIEELGQLVETGDADAVGEYLQESAEVFSGLGESLGLSGFQSIADAIATSIKTHPTRVLEIAPIALDNLQQARQLVLEGDRTSGGEPSQALLHYTQETPSEAPSKPENPPQPREESPDIQDPWTQEDTANNAELEDIFGEVNLDFSQDIPLDEPEFSGVDATEELDFSQPLDFSLSETPPTEDVTPDEELDLTGSNIPITDDSTPDEELDLTGSEIPITDDSTPDEELDLTGSEIPITDDSTPDEELDLTGSNIPITDDSTPDEELDLTGSNIPITEESTTDGEFDFTIAETPMGEDFDFTTSPDEELDFTTSETSFAEDEWESGVGSQTDNFNPSPNEELDLTTSETSFAEDTETEEELDFTTTPDQELDFTPSETSFTEDNGTEEELDFTPSETSFTEDTSRGEAFDFTSEEELDFTTSETSFGEVGNQESEAEPTTNNQQPTTSNQQPTTNNQQPTTNNQQLPSLESTFGDIDLNDLNDPNFSDEGELTLDFSDDWNEELERSEPETVAAEKELPTTPSELVTTPSQPLDQPPQKNTPSRVSKQPSQNTPTPPQQTLRIDLNQLEHLNHLVGELLINQNQLALRDEQFQTAVGKLSNWLRQHRSTLNELRTHLSPPDQNGNGNSRQLSPSQRLLYTALEEASQLSQATEDMTLLNRTTASTVEREQRLSKQLRDNMQTARMIPLETLLKRFPPMVKQLSYVHRKPVELTLKGTQVMVDKTITDNLYDALLHLVRNAFDHGIESGEVRQQRGKPETGQMEISAYNQGNRTIIEIKDDGGGLSVEKICDRAYKNGLISEQERSQLLQHPQPDDRLLDLLTQPGFSTASQVSDLSGRGVGLDVVKTQLERVKGSISVRSFPQKGTIFSIQIRESLMTARLLICQVDQVVYGFVSNEVEQVLIPGEKLRLLAGQKVLDWNQEEGECTIPVYELSSLFHYPTRPRDLGQGKGGVNGQDQALDPLLKTPDEISPVLLLNTSEGLIGLEVDRVVEEQELVIKPISSAIVPPPYIYGCSILADGRLTLVIDGSSLVSHAQKKGMRLIQQASPLPEAENLPTPALSSSLSTQELGLFISTHDTPETTSPSPEETTPEPEIKTILIVDDSLTERQTLNLMLERRNYRVLQANDGLEALEKVKTEPNINLILCDIEMPRMNGLEFLSLIQQQKENLGQVPIIILTSRSRDKFQHIALELGAFAYLTKPYLEQEILSTIEEALTP